MDKILRKLEAFKSEKRGCHFAGLEDGGSRFDNKSLHCLIAIFFLFFRIKRQFFLPESTISYIENKLEYDKKVRELSRKETIDTYIDNAIKTLNENTCPLGYNNEHFCDLNLDDGLRKVLINITQNTNHVLDCSSSKFTIVLFLENYPNHNNDYSLTFENKSLKRWKKRVQGLKTNNPTQNHLCQNSKTVSDEKEIAFSAKHHELQFEQRKWFAIRSNDRL
ncbi:MAG: hypothetical protein IPO04_07940 [Cytophagaceae bacterium]|nr:hypothetical protein [Cytophagaceae bacterium]